MDTDFETLIIGGGLAGCCLAAELMDRGRSVGLIDDPGLSACSRQAMGIVNPLVLRSLRLQEQISEIQGEIDFFAQARRRYGQLYQDRAVVHIFGDDAERQRWEGRATVATQTSLGPISLGPLPEPWSRWGFGHGAGWATVLSTGIVDAAAFIAQTRSRIERQGRWLNQTITDTDISWTAEIARCGKTSVQRIVFCEGWRITQNPLWRRVGLKPSKGETLSVELPGTPEGQPLPADCPILHTDMHMVAQVNSARPQIRLGSSHAWDQLNDDNTEVARAQLLERLSRIYQGPLMVVDQQNGIRPAARDRRPILGFHPQTTRLAALNGLGMRGILLAPGLAWLLANALEGDDRIPPIWNIGRFWQER